jgi:hypothetical protein
MHWPTPLQNFVAAICLLMMLGYLIAWLLGYELPKQEWQIED